MSQTVLRLKAVKARGGLSRSAIYAQIQAGTFPAAVHLGSRAIGWLDATIDDWIESRVRASAATAAPADTNARIEPRARPAVSMNRSLASAQETKK